MPMKLERLNELLKKLVQMEDAEENLEMVPLYEAALELSKAIYGEHNLKTLEILFWATSLLLLIIPGLYCVIHDIGHVTIILAQLVSLVMFGLLALVFHLIRGYLPVKS